MRALTRCTSPKSSAKQDAGLEGNQVLVASGPGLSIVLAMMMTVAGAYAMYFALQRGKEKWRARRQRPSHREAEPSGVTLQAAASVMMVPVQSVALPS